VPASGFRANPTDTTAASDAPSIRDPSSSPSSTNPDPSPSPTQSNSPSGTDNRPLLSFLSDLTLRRIDKNDRRRSSARDVSRSIPVGPTHYETIDATIIDLLVNACRPLFVDPKAEPQASLSPAELVLAVSDLLAAAAFKMKEQARVEMAEEDLGGGMFDDDVEAVREGASKCSEPQVYDADEQEVLDEQLAILEAPAPALKKYKMPTKLTTAFIEDVGKGVELRLSVEIRTSPEQVVAYYMGHAPQYATQQSGRLVVMGERSSNHSVVTRVELVIPPPFASREIVVRTLWTKLDDNTFFVTQTAHDHPEFPRRDGFVRMVFARAFKLTRLGAKLTRLDACGNMNLGGSVPRWLNDTITVPYIAKAPVSVLKFFILVRPADSFDEGDAKQLGQLIFLELYPHRQVEHVLREKIDRLIRMTNVLRRAQAKYR
jgi:hypothetical protein